ncbi:MAG: 30S ribosomal protein S12 methylthiotransferase RimO [Eubacterium sp.]|nr:30S ribosomal protein S12 methylthiotransferase RimO [Eubacterium sp.]
MIRLYVASLGCDKNLVDTEHMLGSLDPVRYQLTNDEKAADVIVINTCCFIDEAKEESIDTILELARNKEEGACRALIVAGCMAERYREDVLSELPEVDAILGTGSFQRLEEAVAGALEGRRGIFLDTPESAGAGEGKDAIRSDSASRPGTAPEKMFEDAAEKTAKQRRQRRVITTGGYYEYLKIAEGCSKHCTYCVIPQLRGAYRSVPMGQLLQEAEELADAGVKELILIAEETTCYGLDLYGEKKLHELLRLLCGIEGFRWIRVLYCYPEEIYPEMTEVIRQEPKILPYLDLPIQHADDEILRRMGRRATQEGLRETIAALRREMPDIALRTTLITGFPGETEEQHQTLLRFIQDMRFDRLGVFTYSQEEGTPAAAMQDQVPEEVKQRRKEQLLAAQQEISLENGRRRIGSELEVQVDGYLASEEVYVCRTYADAPDVDGLFFMKSDETLDSGMFVKARVTGAMEYDLIGEKLEEPE